MPGGIRTREKTAPFHGAQKDGLGHGGDFTPPLRALEVGLLALPGPPVQSLAYIDRPGARIGVSQGSTSPAPRQHLASTSHGVLGQQLRQAGVAPAASLKAAGEMLQRREIDAVASNKAILFELASGMPGAHVLEGRWDQEPLAIAARKGRKAARDDLLRFAADVKADGSAQRAVERAWLRGAAPAVH